MDPYEKPHIPSWYHPCKYERGVAEQQLREALTAFQWAFFRQKVPGHVLISPQALMPISLLDHIVNLAHYGRLATLDDIRKQLEWAYTKVCGPDILQLIEKSCLVSDKQTWTVKLPPALSPFISTPLH